MLSRASSKLQEGRISSVDMRIESKPSSMVMVGLAVGVVLIFMAGIVVALRAFDSLPRKRLAYVDVANSGWV